MSELEDIKEVWVLRWDTGAILPPLDGDRGDCFMAFRSEQDAVDEGEYQLGSYGEPGQTLTAVRLHPSFMEGKKITERVEEGGE